MTLTFTWAAFIQTLTWIVFLGVPAYFIGKYQGTKAAKKTPVTTTNRNKAIDFFVHNTFSNEQK